MSNRLNGLAFVVLGVALVGLAILLWMFQSKLQKIKTALDNGFKTIEDGIGTVLLNPNAGLDRAVQFLNQTSGVLDQVRGDIKAGKDVIINDVVPIIHDAAQVIGPDVGQPVKDTGGFLLTVGSTINVDILGAHPLSGLAQPFTNAGNDLTNIGDSCLDIGNKMDDAGDLISNAAQSMDSVSAEVKSVSDDLKAVVPLVDVDFRNGLKQIVNQLTQTRTDLNQILSLVSPQLVGGLVILGLIFIAVGAALGP